MSLKKFHSAEGNTKKKKTSKSVSQSKYKKPAKIIFTIILVLIIGASIILFNYFNLSNNLLYAGTIIPGFFLMVMYIPVVNDTDIST